MEISKQKLSFLVNYLFLCIQLCASQREGDRCIDNYTNSVGRCQKVSTCKPAIEDYQFNGIQPTFCSFAYDNTPVVCCRNSVSILQSARPTNGDSSPVWGQVDSPTRRPDPSSDVPSRQGNEKRLSERKCEEYSRSVYETIEFISLLPEPEVMSVSSTKCNYDSVRLIVGGQVTELGEFPHMAAIGWPLARGGYAMKCGGSLISGRYVLTAGHCLAVSRDTSVTSSEPTIVRLGEQNLNPDVYDGANPVEYGIRRLIRHPSYRPPSRYNDIALIELASDVEFSNNIRPACLWPKDDFGDQTKAIATGWGVTDTRTKRTSEDLRKVSLDLLENAVCDPLLAPLRNRHWNGFDRTQMCAGVLQGGKDSCQGDSGGPLQIAAKENHCVFRVVGVTSFGGECAAVNRPAIYTRVSAYLDWIESVVWPQE